MQKDEKIKKILETERKLSGLEVGCNIKFNKFICTTKKHPKLNIILYYYTGFIYIILTLITDGGPKIIHFDCTHITISFLY